MFLWYSDVVSVFLWFFCVSVVLWFCGSVFLLACSLIVCCCLFATPAISYTDYNIGVIVDALDAMEELRDKTAVVVFGDHGECRTVSLVNYTLNWIGLVQRSVACCFSCPLPGSLRASE